jgi:CheY-like chemotaxis protein
MRKYKILQALFPGARCAILSATFVEPSRWWEQAALADQAGVQIWDLEAELDNLVSAGVLKSRANGDAREVCANTEFPFFAEVQSIVTKARLEASAHSGSILVVEDEPATLKIAKILLESWGYQVLLASSGARALEVYERNRDAIRLVLTDIVMPDMTGVQLAEKLLDLDSGLRIVYMSGYHGEGLKQIGRRPVAFLPKPFSPERLARTIREELDRP